jgi:hypothetical protein
MPCSKQNPPKRKKPATFVAGFYVVVRLAGIEPTTPWFVAKYSIQLSYSRTACKYSPLSSTFFEFTRPEPRGRHKRKSPEDTDLPGFSELVRLAGIEPTTPWFVAKYSIQLSYSR